MATPSFNAVDFIGEVTSFASGLIPAGIDLLATEAARIDPRRRDEIRQQILDAQDLRGTREQRLGNITAGLNAFGQGAAALSGNPRLQFPEQTPFQLADRPQSDVFDLVPLDPSQDPNPIASLIDRFGLPDFQLPGNVGQAAAPGGGVPGGPGLNSAFGPAAIGFAPGATGPPPRSGRGGFQGGGAGGALNQPAPLQGGFDPMQFFLALQAAQGGQGAQAGTQGAGQPQLAQGTPNVPGEMTVTLHPGEMVVPAHLNPFAGMTEGLQTFEGGPAPVGPQGVPQLQNGLINVPDPNENQNQLPGQDFVKTGATSAAAGGTTGDGLVIPPNKPFSDPAQTATTGFQGNDRFGQLDTATQNVINQLFQQFGQQTGDPFSFNAGPIQGQEQLNQMAQGGFGFNTDTTPEALAALGGNINQGFTPSLQGDIVSGAGQQASLLQNILADPTGFSQATQTDIFNRGQEQLDLGTQAVQRQLRDAAGSGGQASGGAFDSQALDLEAARINNLAGLQRDIGIAAEDRRFGNLLQAFGAEQGELGRTFGQQLGAGQFEAQTNQQNIANQFGLAGLQGDINQQNFLNQLQQGQANFGNLFSNVGQNAALQNQAFNQAFAGQGFNNQLAQQNFLNQFGIGEFLNNAFINQRDFGQGQIESFQDFLLRAGGLQSGILAETPAATNTVA